MSQGFVFRNLRRLCRICNWACCVRDRVLMLTSLLSLLQAYKQMIQRRHTVYITHTSHNVQYLSLTDIHKSKLTLAYICLLYSHVFTQDVVSHRVSARQCHKATKRYPITYALHTFMWAGIAQRPRRPGNRILVGARFSLPSRPAPLLYNGHRVFPGGKEARAWR
jgi:hypothetical protein